MKNFTYFVFISLITFFTFYSYSHATMLFPSKPAEGEYISDNANVIDLRTEQQIREIADKLWWDKGITLYIITITSLKDYEKADLDVPAYAKYLYRDWIKKDELKNEKIMLLFSLEDDYMQIMLKEGWREKYGQESQKVFDKMIRPPFYEDNYAEALLAGAVGLDEMARKRRYSKEEIAYAASALFFVFIAVFGMRFRKQDRR